MSPRNDYLDMEGDDLPLEFSLSSKRDTAPLARGPARRTKRIRSARRSNPVDGMQRRRNKRIEW